MSVTSTTNRKSYAGDAVTTSFDTNPVVFFDSSDLAVSAISAAGVATTLTEGTHYTVTGGDGSTGTVNTAGGSAPYGAPAVGVTLLILRVVALTQPVDFVQNDGSDAEVQETAYDRLTMMVQQLDEVDDRSLKVSPAEAGTAALTELPFDRASKFLAFDASKNLIAAEGTTEVPVSAFMATVLDDATATDARTTLGAAGSGAVTGSGLTMATARLLGRTTAGAGAVEELTAGSSLSLAGGSLDAALASQAEAQAGSDNTALMTPLRTAEAIVALGGSIILGTPQATTSGTSIDFTGIPARARSITFSFSDLSTNGTSPPILQLGGSGGVENTGYSGAFIISNGAAGGSASQNSSGFNLTGTHAASNVLNGAVTLTLLDASTNTWSCAVAVGLADAAFAGVGGGSKSLSGTLDRIRLTTSGGANTFDAGKINISYQ